MSLFTSKMVAFGQAPPKTFFMRLAVMRHHGVPTRLLDWSEDALCALFFATRSNSREDSCVWCLDPGRLGASAVIGQGEPLSNASFLVGDRDPILEEYENPDQHGLTTPIPMFPAYLSKRIVAQSGRFTVHCFEKGELERLHARFEDLSPPTWLLRRLVVPKDARVSIREELRKLGASQERFFPDLDGLAASVTEDTKRSIRRFEESAERQNSANPLAATDSLRAERSGGC